MKTTIKIFATLALLFATSSFVAAQNSMVKHINQDEFRAQICDFVQSSTWQYKGKKPCVIDFYATWCGPCKKFMPVIHEVYEEYSGSGLIVLGVNVSDDPDKARDFIANSDMEWDVIITEGNSVQAMYNCTGIPSCYLISPDGKILEAGVHPVQLKETLKKYFENEQE